MSPQFLFLDEPQNNERLVTFRGIITKEGAFIASREEELKEGERYGGGGVQSSGFSLFGSGFALHADKLKLEL